MSAYIEPRKGTRRAVLHDQPDFCGQAKTLPNPTGVSNATASRGLMLGQWNKCPECLRIGDTITARESI